jgi:hypothetical protein
MRHARRSRTCGTMRTDAVLETIVQRLQVNCGDRYDACRQANVSMVFLEQWVKDDQDVAARVREAERVGAYALESEAIRRAVHGEEKGVYFKGERVGTEYNRSDGLLSKLLEGRLPERYKKGAEQQGGITINGGQAQINIMPRAANYDEWLSMKESTLALRARQETLPAPEADIEITAKRVSPFEGLGL